MKNLIKKLLCVVIAAASVVSLTACVMSAAEAEDYISLSAGIVVANAPEVSARKVVIHGNPVNVRSGPGKSYSVIGKTSKGKSFVYLASKKDKDGTVWYKIQFTSSKTGWVISTLSNLTEDNKTPSKTTATTTTPAGTTAASTNTASTNTASTTAVKTTTATKKASSEKTVIISGNPVNVRSGAGKNYAKVGSTSKGKKFKLLDTKKDSSGTKWYKIQFTSSKVL